MLKFESNNSNEDFVEHELFESPRVSVRLNAGNIVSVRVLGDLLDQALTYLVRVPRLQVVNDRNVVNSVLVPELMVILKPVLTTCYFQLRDGAALFQIFRV